MRFRGLAFAVAISAAVVATLIIAHGQQADGPMNSMFESDAPFVMARSADLEQHDALAGSLDSPRFVTVVGAGQAQVEPAEFGREHGAAAGCQGRACEKDVEDPDWANLRRLATDFESLPAREVDPGQVPEAPEAFEAAPPPSGEAAVPPPNALRQRFVTARRELREQLSLEDGALRSLTLNLFQDTGYRVVFDRVEFKTPDADKLVAYGRTVDVEDGEVVAVLNGDTLAANLTLPSGEIYSITSTDSGLLRVKQLDRTAIGDCGVDEEQIHLDEAFLSTGQTGEFSGGEVAGLDGSTTLDVLVVYSAAARRYAGGQTAIENLIELNVSTINQIYGESNASPRLRLVHTEEVDYQEHSHGGFPYMRNALFDAQGGDISNLHDLRDQYGADLVSFFIRRETGSGIAGIAYLPWFGLHEEGIAAFGDYGFSVIAVQSSEDATIMAHELGHNQGNNHDRTTIINQGYDPVDSADRTTPYAFGYIEPSRHFHTVMAYPQSCNNCYRLPRFSNPDGRYGGRATGASSADASRILDENRAGVMSWRPAVTSAGPEIYEPDPGSTLPGDTVTFRWNANGTSVTEWWLYVGSENGARDLHNSGSLQGALSTTVSGLPTDGRSVHVRLFYKVQGSWQNDDFVYTAAINSSGGSEPTITSPAPGSTLPGSVVTFRWDANGTPVTEWWMYVGTSTGSRDLLNSGSLGTRTSLTVTGLPTNGGTVYVRLFHKVQGSWQNDDFVYTAAGDSTDDSDPTITSPAPGSTLPGSAVNFWWDANGTSVTEWWMYVGTSTGSRDLLSSGSLGTRTSLTVTGLPTNGGPVYVRLFYKVQGSWQNDDFVYTAAINSSGGSEPTITSPAPGSTLPGSVVTFQWTANGTPVTEWWMYLGTSAGSRDLLSSGSLGTRTSLTVIGLPTDGGTVYVRLFHKVQGSWQNDDFVYTEAGNSRAYSSTGNF